MIIRLTIEDDNGEIFWEDIRDACVPFDLKLPNDRPIRGEKYAYFGFVYQPICKAIYREK